MKVKKMETFLNKLDANDLDKFDELYNKREDELMIDYWTLERVNYELNSDINRLMREYLEDIGEENYYPNDFDHKVDLDMGLFTKFFGVASIEDIIDSLTYYRQNRYNDDFEDCVDFDRDGYCKYYHELMVRNNKLGILLE